MVYNLLKCCKYSLLVFLEDGFINKSVVIRPIATRMMCSSTLQEFVFVLAAGKA
jgi:hypothetical protein